jgi:hypothetical protein
MSFHNKISIMLKRRTSLSGSSAEPLTAVPETSPKEDQVMAPTEDRAPVDDGNVGERDFIDQQESHIDEGKSTEESLANDLDVFQERLDTKCHTCARHVSVIKSLEETKAQLSASLTSERDRLQAALARISDLESLLYEAHTRTFGDADATSASSKDPEAVLNTTQKPFRPCLKQGATPKRHSKSELGDGILSTAMQPQPKSAQHSSPAGSDNLSASDRVFYLEGKCRKLTAQLADAVAAVDYKEKLLRAYRTRLDAISDAEAPAMDRQQSLESEAKRVQSDAENVSQDDLLAAQARVARLESDLSKARGEARMHMSIVDAFYRCMGGKLTPRLILGARAFARTCPPPSSALTVDFTSFLDSPEVRSNTSWLDLQLQPAGLEQFLKYVHADRKSGKLLSAPLEACPGCGIPKLMTTDKTKIGEFASTTTSCCHQTLCTACLRTCLLKHLDGGWWHNIKWISWFVCPAKDCRSLLSINSQSQYLEQLRLSGERHETLKSCGDRYATNSLYQDGD